jgi:hypothetical protein
MKLGKLPFTPDPRDLMLSRYLIHPHPKPALPPHPAEFGHEKLIKVWGMLGNDELGDCVFAGAGHEVMLWTAEAGSMAAFSTESVIADYSEVTGYTPTDPTSDQGTIVRDALKFRSHKGSLAADGGRHKLSAYLGIQLKNLDELQEAAWLFSAVGVGIRFPASAMAQFDKGQPWEVVPHSKIEGGHYVPIVAFHGGYLWCVTWGRIQPMTPAFWHAYGDEAWALLSHDYTTGEHSPEGYDFSTLQRDIAALKAA